MDRQRATEWLSERLEATGIGTLSALAELTDINKGTLSKYFRGEQRPSIDVVAPLCEALKVSPETLLLAMGAITKHYADETTR